MFRAALRCLEVVNAGKPVKYIYLPEISSSEVIILQRTDRKRTKMDFLSGFSSLVKEAGSQFESLVQSVVLEDSDARTLNAASREVEMEASRRALLQADVPEALCQLIIGLGQNIDAARGAFLQRFEKNPNSAESFTMTPTRLSHARSVVKAVPGLDRLRFQLCPSVMADKTFWSIYFMLVESEQAEIDKLASELCLQGSKEQTRRKQAQARQLGKKVSSAEGDTSMVSNLIDSAKKTLKFAEHLIETVDEQASFVIRPAMVPPRVLESASYVEEYSSVAKQALKLSEIDQAVPEKVSSSEAANRSRSREQETRGANPFAEDKRQLERRTTERQEPEEEDDWSHVVVEDDEVLVCESPRSSQGHPQ